MSDARPAIPFETIEKSIWLIRGQKIILEAIRALMKEPAKKKKAIGFGAKEAKAKYGK